MKSIFSACVVIREKDEFDPKILISDPYLTREHAQRAIATCLLDDFINSKDYQHCESNSEKIVKELRQQARNAFDTGRWADVIKVADAMNDAKQSGAESLTFEWDITETKLETLLENATVKDLIEVEADRQHKPEVAVVIQDKKAVKMVYLGPDFNYMVSVAKLAGLSEIGVACVKSGIYTLIMDGHNPADTKDDWRYIGRKEYTNLTEANASLVLLVNRLVEHGIIEGQPA